MPTRLLSSFLTRAINRQLTTEQRQQFARHAERRIALRLPPLAIGWRITAEGSFTLTSPLLDADVRITWHSSNGIQVQGDAALLNILSDFWRQIDLPVALSEPFGATLAPRMLFAIERLDEIRTEMLKRHTVNAADFAVFRENTARLHDQTTQLGKRLAALR